MQFQFQQNSVSLILFHTFFGLSGNGQQQGQKCIEHLLSLRHLFQLLISKTPWPSPQVFAVALIIPMQGLFLMHRWRFTVRIYKSMEQPSQSSKESELQYLDVSSNTKKKKKRMISVHFQGKPFSITVIQVYTPATDAKAAEVNWFYEDLQHLL